MNYFEDNECFELGRLVRAQQAAFNNPDYQYEEWSPLDGFGDDIDLLNIEGKREVDPMLDLEMIIDDQVLEMDDEIMFFGIDSSPSYQKQKSFSVPFSVDIGKKRKKFKKLIGKLLKERRHSDSTKVKQQRRKSYPYSQTKVYGDNHMYDVYKCASIIL